MCAFNDTFFICYAFIDTVETPTLVGDVGKIITAAQCGGQFSVLVGPGGVEGEAKIMSYTDKVLAGPAGMEKYKLLASWAELGTLGGRWK